MNINDGGELRGKIWRRIISGDLRQRASYRVPDLGVTPVGKGKDERERDSGAPRQNSPTIIY